MLLSSEEYGVGCDLGSALDCDVTPKLLRGCGFEFPEVYGICVNIYERMMIQAYGAFYED